MYIKSNIHESKLVFIHYTNSFSKMQLCERPGLMCAREGLALDVLLGRGQAWHLKGQGSPGSCDVLPEHKGCERGLNCARSI